MAIDGDLLFQSDRDADVISILSKKYGIELGYFLKERKQSSDVQTPEIEAYPNLTEAEARAKLNNGLLTQIISEHLAMNTEALLHLFLFMIKAMEAGATFSDEQLELLKQRVPVIEHAGIFFPGGLNQIKAALRDYPNDGTPYVRDHSLSEWFVDL